MADLLVRLYALPALPPAVAALEKRGIGVRRALPSERPLVTSFARAGGSEGWAAECEVTFARVPISCFLAVAGGRDQADADQSERTGTAVTKRAAHELLGIACYEASCRNFFGPMLVRADRRGEGIGRALLLAALHAMRAEGYGYAIIGWASSAGFYQRALGAEVASVIDGSEPGIYPPPLKPL